MSTIGECNILNEDDVNEEVNIIEENMDHLLDPETQVDTVVTITDKIRDIDSENLYYKESKVKESRNKKVDEMDFDEYETQQIYEGYIHGFDKGHMINIKYSGEQILNKRYNRLGEEATENDWIIKIVNMPGQPDLLTYLSELKSDELSTITFEDIVLFLKSKMVDTLIVFDFSCSDIMDKDGWMNVSPRTSRKTRRSMTSYDPKTKRLKLNPNFGGKRRKTKKVKRVKRIMKRRVKRKRTKSKRIMNK